MQEHNAIINDEQNDLKKRATRRLIVAVSLVLAAVAILTVLSKQKPSKPVTQELPSTSVQLRPQPAVEPQPANETPPVPEPESKPSEAPLATAAPENLPEAPPPPQVSAQPEIKQPQPGPTVQKRPTHTQPTLTIESASRTATQPAVKPVIAAPASAPAPKPLAAGTAPKAFVLQLGVFSNPANAIQLQEKLAQHGIQSYTETRVHVGPFKNKAEADEAMEKIRTLGIGAVVVQH